MDKKTAHAIARIPDDNPEDFLKLVQIAVVWDTSDYIVLIDDGGKRPVVSPQRYGVRFTTDYSERVDYDRREALESLRQLR